MMQKILILNYLRDKFSNQKSNMRRGARNAQLRLSCAVELRYRGDDGGLVGVLQLWEDR